MGMTIRASGIMSRAYAGNVYFKDENYRKNSSNHDVVSADRKAMARVLERLKTLDFEGKEEDDTKSVYETVTSYLDIYNHTVSSTDASDSSDIRRISKNMKELMRKYDSSLEAIGIERKSDGTVKIDKGALKKATARQMSRVFGNSDYLSEMNRLTRKLRNQVNREIPRQQIQPANTKSSTLLSESAGSNLNLYV